LKKWIKSFLRFSINLLKTPKERQSFYRFWGVVSFIVFSVFVLGIFSPSAHKKQPLSLERRPETESLSAYNKNLQKMRRNLYIQKHQRSLEILGRIEFEVPDCCFLKKLSMKKEKYFCEILLEKPCDLSVISLLWPQDYYDYQILKIEHKNSECLLSLELDLR